MNFTLTLTLVFPYQERGLLGRERIDLLVLAADYFT